MRLLLLDAGLCIGEFEDIAHHSALHPMAIADVVVGGVLCTLSARVIAIRAPRGSG